ncbi:Hint domain-containing protein [Pseudoroseomonas cervicalis]|uniref:Hint domain-containing protein n=1 Tax=Teichococcus cervicalis TaxID=204525 RepID=UPI0022F189AF|nr:Hint domain-containing protein [Pseudoroseomonas cervicalis]WBV44434.1 Hint domain-containing protein [Pseudoroseomonas cervicalis]
MATYQTSFVYGLSSDGGQWSVQNAGPGQFVASDQDSDDTLDGSDITLTANGGYVYYDLAYMGSYGNGWVGSLRGDFYLFSNDTVPVGTVFIANPAPLATCFATGTAIGCPGGARPVQSLCIGDLVLTATGEARPVRWIGRQEIIAFFDRGRSNPIRLQAGALGQGLPQRELFVSPDHALFLDGVLVQAGALVNGTTIRQVQAGERFAYFHIELDNHALVLAEGVPAETFVDNVTRARFDNHAEFIALYGEAPVPTGEMDVPRVKSQRQLPGALRARLAERAALLAAAAA